MDLHGRAACSVVSVNRVSSKPERENGINLGQDWFFRFTLHFFLRLLSSFPLAHPDSDWDSSMCQASDLLPVTWQARTF